MSSAAVMIGALRVNICLKKRGEAAAKGLHYVLQEKLVQSSIASSFQA